MPPASVAVAYSGGRDSTALLHATLAAAAPSGLRVLALHVHHGLSRHADRWLDHCADQCRRWAARGVALEFAAQRLTTRPATGDSVEAWARDARYAALRSMAVDRGATLVLLAQHRLDQAETFMLQALRGGGVAGLAGMPPSVDREGVTWARPWLHRSRADIDAYLKRHRLRFVDDDSNADTRLDRNRLRRDVWPALATAFSQAEATLARAAAWAQEADAALREWGQADVASVSGPDGLRLAPWLLLSAPRRSLALRSWLQSAAGTAPAASLTMRLMAELPSSGAGCWPMPSGELRLYRGVLRLRRPQPAAAAPRETTFGLRRAGRYRLPGWRGTLTARRVTQGGVPLAWLAQVDLRPRGGGERFQSAPGRPARSLKKQFQGRGLAAWDRAGPLVYSGGLLVFVPGLGLDARVVGLPGQALIALDWEPDEPDAAGR